GGGGGGGGGGSRTTPYSMVAATKRDMPDDHIVINRWLADDLRVGVGDAVTLTYSVFGDGRRITKHSATFTVHAVEPTEGPGGDRHLMPAFPGLADTTSIDDWDPPEALGVDLRRIRDQDEEYWDDHRGAPKAFVTLNWATGHWSNRYGNRTALRWELADHRRDDIAAALRADFDPASIGFIVRPVRGEALAASRSGTDFSGLFIGLSFFIIFAALLLTALLFVLGVERRTPEIGTLLALGFTPKQVRRLWLGEGALLAFIGSLIGLAGGVAYTRVVLWGLTTQWQDAAPIPALHFHAQPATLVGGLIGGVLVALGSMAWVMRKQAGRPARALLAARFGLASLAAGGKRAKRNLAIGGFCFGGAVAIVVSVDPNNHAAGAFFGAGGLLLFAGLFLASALLRGVRRDKGAAAVEAFRFTSRRLAWRNASRRLGRSLATISMLACGCFLVTAINAFRHDASDAAGVRQSGTGGFAIWAQTRHPVLGDLNTEAGLEFFALGPEEIAPGSVVQMRLREGDDASCLNLNKPQTPSLLGVDPEELASRDAYAFGATLTDPPEGASPWTLLAANDDDPNAPVPAVLDGSVATYILKKRLGDTIEYTDDNGRTFDVQIVGTLANSILQGNLIISEEQFRRRYPTISGYRVLTVDAAPEAAEATQRALENGLGDLGINAMPAPERLAMFLKMENTYLTIFGVLGGLGLILGCVGLGLLVMRNVLERRAEFGLMRAFGFRQPALRSLVLVEHGALLILGLFVGAGAAFVAIIPAAGKPGVELPMATIAWTLTAIAVSGVVWTLVATVLALRGGLMAALRSE
ncbi:MAG: ABC transporter permease, partial [Planctomycetota bacterium]